MKKLLALALTCLMSVSILSACGNDSSGSSSSKSGSSSQVSKDPVTITVWHMWGEDEEPTTNHQRFLKWAEEFNSTNTDNITVEVSGAKTADVIMTTIAAGSTPDIFQNYWNNAPTWADNGALYDLTDFVNNDTEWNKDDIMPAAWKLCTYNDKIYSIPSTFSSTYIFYRKDLLAEAGWDAFPTTLEELAQCIKDTTKVESDGTITQMGMIPDYPWLDNVLWPAAFGAEWVDGDQVNFNNIEMLAAYQFQKDIYDEYGYTEVKRFQDSLGARATTEDPLFTGKLAMRWQADSALASMEEAGEGADWDIVEFPKADNGKSNQMLTCGVWEMNAKTKNPDAAWKVLASLTSSETMKVLAEGDYNNGSFWARKSALEYVANDLDVSDKVKQVANLLLNGNFISFPVSGYISEYLSIINGEMSLALSGDTTVEAAAQKVQDQVSELAK